MDPIRKQALRDVLIMLSILVVVMPSALLGIFLCFSLFGRLAGLRSDVFLTPLQLLGSLICCVVGIIVGGCVGGWLWVFTMKRILTTEEIEREVLAPRIPIFTPVSLWILDHRQ